MLDYYQKAKLFYDKGDYAKAVPLFKKAASKGNAEAMFSLGVIYLMGKSVPPDITLAKAYINKAKEHHHPVAFFYTDLLEGVTQEDVVCKE